MAKQKKIITASGDKTIKTTSPKQIILGTAGHIDHGKTSLIKALTGINTDRLKEEQRRGITIELGFAGLDLASGRHLGIVDVPGHEKFIKNMVAGATGIDMVALIIAADEGVMPQTREHMDICSLLGVQHGLVALTKIDMVDEEWRELVIEDVENFVKDTFLEDQPIMPVSSVSGQGLLEFVQALDNLSEKIPLRTSSGLLRLPADRVFSMKGFGTVITGTLVSGQISAGQNIMIYPSEIEAKVRGIQVHNQNVEWADAGMRTAVNFQGLDRSIIQRGDVVSTPGALKPSFMVDIMFHFLKSNKKPLKNRTRIRFHAGTSEIMGNLILLETDEIQPGEKAVAQLRLDTPAILVKDDRFVIRSYSPVRTIGGGLVINPIPKKHKRFNAELITALNAVGEQTTDQMICSHVKNAGYQGLCFADLRIMTDLSEKNLNHALQLLLSKKILMQTDKDRRIYIHQDTAALLRQEIQACLKTYHKANPLKPGMVKEELKSRFPAFLGAKSLNMVLNQMIKAQDVVQEEDIVRLKNHTISLGEDQTQIREKILQAYVKTGLTPPYFKNICENLKINPSKAKDVLMILIDDGCLIKAKDDLYFHAEAVEVLKNKVVDFIENKGQMTTIEFKGLAGVSRKYLIPLIEYFDDLRLTIRIGDIRKLRGR